MQINEIFAGYGIKIVILHIILANIGSCYSV